MKVKTLSAFFAKILLALIVVLSLAACSGSDTYNIVSDQSPSIKPEIQYADGMNSITYTVNVKNNSNYDITGMTIRGIVPPKTTRIDSWAGAPSKNPGNFDSAGVTWVNPEGVKAGGTLGPFTWTVSTKGADEDVFSSYAVIAWGDPKPGTIITDPVTTSPLTTYPYLKRKVVSDHGMVSAIDPRAAIIGVEILKRGGNAVDAAIATAFVLHVVEPQNSGPGGHGGFMLIYMAKEDKVYAIDYNSRCPLKSKPDQFVATGMPSDGYMIVGVPAQIAGYALAMKTFGTMSLKDVILPAIPFAENGYEVNEPLAETIASSAKGLAKYPASAKIYLKADGSPYKTGERIVNKDLANTFKKIAEGGPDVFYKGEIADAIANDMALNKGLITKEDLAKYQPILTTAAMTTYKGYEVYAYPINSGGAATIPNFNLLAGIDLAPLGALTKQSIHLRAEAMKLTFADRLQYVGDPDFVQVPYNGLLSKAYSDERRKLIDPNKATTFTAGDPWKYNNEVPRNLSISVARQVEDSDTTHISVIDKDHNMVALTTSNQGGFGSKVVVPGTGIILNNTISLFNVAPGTSNSIGPWVRSLRNTNPILIKKGGKPFMALGCPGGRMQISAIPVVFSNMVEFGMGLQEAIDAPRFHTEGGPLIVQSRVPADVQAELKAMGHTISVINAYGGIATVQGVMIDPTTGKLYGGADPGAPGIAYGY